MSAFENVSAGDTLRIKPRKGLLNFQRGLTYIVTGFETDSWGRKRINFETATIFSDEDVCEVHVSKYSYTEKKFEKYLEVVK